MINPLYLLTLPLFIFGLILLRKGLAEVIDLTLNSSVVNFEKDHHVHKSS